MTCGDDDDKIAADGNLFGDSTTAVVNWRSDDGENTLAAPTRETPTEAVTCTLSLDWVGSNDLDGPITYEFKAAIVPDPHTAPATVRALAESYDSAYVEWTLVTGTVTQFNATPTPPETADATHDDPEKYVISWKSSTMGARSSSTTVDADANPADATNTEQDARKRQGARITGLTPDADYTITVAGLSGKDELTNYGRASMAATSGFVMADGTVATALIETVTTQTRYYKAGPPPKVDNTFELSTGETVELDPKEYLLNLALHGRDDFGLAVDATEYNEYVRGTEVAPVTVMYAITSNKFVESLYVSTDPNSQAEDLVLLKGLTDGTSNLTLVATMGMNTISAQMTVKVLENHVPLFTVTEASVIWQIDKDKPGDGIHTQFEIDLMAEFVIGGSFEDEDQGACDDDDASNDINCDEKLTFSISSISGATGYTSPSSYFEITEENENVGLITTKAANPDITPLGTAAFVNALERLDDEDEIGMTVTVEDASGGKDTL